MHHPVAAPMTAFAIELACDLRHGRCVAVTLPPAPTEGAVRGAAAAEAVPSEVLACLPGEEREVANRLTPSRRVTWVGGRLALRAALSDLGFTAGPLLPDDRGAPKAPTGAVASISHKARLAVALAAPDRGWAVGIDLEDPVVPRRRDISRYVLREDERQQLPAPGDGRRALETLIRFAAKEAVYKAVDPFLRRYVSFQEVRTARDAGGSLEAQLALRAGEGAFEVEVDEIAHPTLVLITARARPTALRR